jgi:hypothetical protein
MHSKLVGIFSHAHESYLSNVEDEKSYKLESGNSSKINFIIFKLF